MNNLQLIRIFNTGYVPYTLKASKKPINRRAVKAGVRGRKTGRMIIHNHKASTHLCFLPETRSDNSYRPVIGPCVSGVASRTVEYVKIRQKIKWKRVCG